MKQFQVLGVLMVMFLVLAAFMVFLDNRASNQQSLQSSTATEMQMLSQRLARGTALAAQGQASAFAAVKDSRDRFKADLDALVKGGTFKGTSLDQTQESASLETLNGVKQRWERVDAAAGRVIDNQKSLTSLAKGWTASTRATTRCSSLPSRRRSRSAKAAAACAKSTSRTSSPCCRSGSRRTRTRSPRPTRSIPKSRSCSARTTGDVSRHR